jgi:hypothetical protein
MSKNRIYYWMLYLVIVIISTYVFKKIETETSLFQLSLNKYTSWFIYAVIIITGYKKFVFDPRKKGE